AALEAVMRNEGGLHRMQRRFVAQAFDRKDIAITARHRKIETGVAPYTVNEHRTGAALAVVTAFLCSRKAEMIAQRVEKRDARVEGELAITAVHRQAD